MILVSKIQKFLKQKGIITDTGQDKAKKKDFIQNSGVAESTISKIKKASQLNTDLDTILKIAIYYDCTTDKVIGRKLKRKKGTDGKNYNIKYKNLKFNKISIEKAYLNLRKFIKDKLEEKQLEDKNFTPYELAQKLGFSSDAIRHFIRENNPQKTLGILIIVAIADYFEISLIDIMIGRVSPANLEEKIESE